MGYMIVMGMCYCCPTVFGFNATSVPSFNGKPICPSCIARINELRAIKGLPQWPVAADAYAPEEVA